MKAILMSIQSKWLAKILNGDKSAELRKRFPKDYRGWVYLYCTKAKPYLIRFFGRHFITYYLDPEIKDDGLVKNGLVVARVWVDNVEQFIYNDGGYSEPMFIQKNGDNVVFDNYKLTPMEIKSCVEFEDWLTYSHNGKYADASRYSDLFAIYLSKLEIFGKPKELGEFNVERYAEMPNGVFPCYEPIIKAPQSWQYIYIEEEKL